MKLSWNEINLRFLQEMDSMMSMMHTQFNGAISSAIAERTILEIQNMVSTLFQESDTESSSTSNNQESCNGTTGFKSKI